MPCVFGECRFVNDDQIDIGGNTSQETLGPSSDIVGTFRGPTGLKLKQVCDCKSVSGTVFEYDKYCALILPPDKCPCQNGICKPIPRKAFWQINFSFKIVKVEDLIQKPNQPVTTTNYLDVQYAESKNLIEFKYSAMTIRFKCYCSYGQRYDKSFSQIFHKNPRIQQLHTVLKIASAVKRLALTKERSFSKFRFLSNLIQSVKLDYVD